ncbi:MAG: HTH domain-containing protein, partial [Candidatus Omnitrophica bacterium]|nr:HTH domain-containing protein [Candidatus Omnitrophota bacterium]
MRKQGIKKSILKSLSGGEYVSGEAMSRELGCSRAGVWK